MELTANHITLRGSLFSMPQFSHENHGRRFFRFLLEVPRLSGAVDVLPVIAREDVLNAMRNAGLTERHGRALLRLETPAEQREALAYILSRDLNVAATDAYIERLLEAKTAPESEQQKTFILKDVRVFLNTISHSLDLMKQGGIDAGMRRQETDEALILTINIPKARRREPAPKQAEPVPVG